MVTLTERTLFQQLFVIVCLFVMFVVIVCLLCVVLIWGRSWLHDKGDELLQCCGLTLGIQLAVVCYVEAFLQAGHQRHPRKPQMERSKQRPPVIVYLRGRLTVSR